MRRAVFLDRDGTICKEAGGVLSPAQLRLLPHAAEAVKQFNRLGFLNIVVTNQAWIARGVLDKKVLDKIHRVLTGRFRRLGAPIDAIYYCPHHPEGVVVAYRQVCNCRKPQIGLLRQAAREHGINLKRSFFIGDMTGDILAGKRAGTTTILVETGYAGKDARWKVKPDFTVRTLYDAISIIKKYVPE